MHFLHDRGLNVFDVYLSDETFKQYFRALDGINRVKQRLFFGNSERKIRRNIVRNNAEIRIRSDKEFDLGGEVCIFFADTVENGSDLFKYRRRLVGFVFVQFFFFYREPFRKHGLTGLFQFFSETSSFFAVKSDAQNIFARLYYLIYSRQNTRVKKIVSFYGLRRSVFLRDKQNVRSLVERIFYRIDGKFSFDIHMNDRVRKRNDVAERNNGNSVEFILSFFCCRNCFFCLNLSHFSSVFVMGELLPVSIQYIIA